MERKLAVILSADVAGYSRLVAADEEGTLATLAISPHGPLAYLFLNWIALAQYHLGNYEEVLHHAGRAAGLRRVRPILTVLLACQGQLGQMEKAQAIPATGLARR